jgi:hypothetical protein
MSSFIAKKPDRWSEETQICLAKKYLTEADVTGRVMRSS